MPVILLLRVKCTTPRPPSQAKGLLAASALNSCSGAGFMGGWEVEGRREGERREEGRREEKKEERKKRLILG